MIELDRLTLHAGDFHLRDVSFVVPSGQYAVLMGRTGSGKTTILEAVLGLRRVSAGAIRLHGRDVTLWRPAVRGVGYVPQDGALFRTMTVRDQIGLGLVIRKVPTADIRRRVDEVAHWLGIAPLLERKPQGLSGGERQRVALGRALSFRPQILCLDEPLSALDDATRSEMVALLKRVQKEAGVTALHVTHNVSEAEQLADVRLHLRDGRIWQNGVEKKVEREAK
jgi:ABC-type sugar transport system ATPase subunit